MLSPCRSISWCRALAKERKIRRILVACCRACNMIKGRKVYGSFDEAKAYVLQAREDLRKTWDARVKGAADKAATSAAKTRAARA